MKLKSYSSWVIPALFLAFVVGACADDEWQATETPTFAKDCPPGQVAKGKCDEPPPPPPPDGPVEPDLPNPAPRGGLVKPNRIAVTPDGNFLVADPHTRRIVYVESATLRETASLEIDGIPSGVALLQNRIYIGNASAGGIDVHEAAGGGFVSSFGASDIMRPADLAADEEAGLLFVVDSEGGQVVVFDTNGTVVRRISSKGIGVDQLMAPVGIALDRTTGEVFVSDRGDFGSADKATAYVKIFAYDGTYVTSISGVGDCGMTGCSGGFSKPHGLALANGNVFITDVLVGQVLVFSRSTLASVATVGSKPQLRLPTDVVVINNSDLYVASTRTGSIEPFPGGAQ